MPSGVNGCGDDAVRSLAEIARDLDVDAKAKECTLTTPDFLVRGFRRVVGANVGAVADVALALGR